MVKNKEVDNLKEIKKGGKKEKKKEEDKGVRAEEWRRFEGEENCKVANSTKGNYVFV